MRRVQAVQEHSGKQAGERAAPVCRELAAAVQAELELVVVRAQAVELVAAVWAMEAPVEIQLSKGNG